MGAAKGSEKKSVKQFNWSTDRDMQETKQATTKITANKELVGKLLSLKEPTPLHIHSQESDSGLEKHDGGEQGPVRLCVQP